MRLHMTLYHNKHSRFKDIIVLYIINREFTIFITVADMSSVTFIDPLQTSIL
jgi:hypothetical protein